MNKLTVRVVLLFAFTFSALLAPFDGWLLGLYQTGLAVAFAYAATRLSGRSTVFVPVTVFMVVVVFTFAVLYEIGSPVLGEGWPTFRATLFAVFLHDPISGLFFLLSSVAALLASWLFAGTQQVGQGGLPGSSSR